MFNKLQLLLLHPKELRIDENFLDTNERVISQFKFYLKSSIAGAVSIIYFMIQYKENLDSNEIKFLYLIFFGLCLNILYFKTFDATRYNIGLRAAKIIKNNSHGSLLFNLQDRISLSYFIRSVHIYIFFVCYVSIFIFVSISLFNIEIFTSLWSRKLNDTPENNQLVGYVASKVWTWDGESGRIFAKLNT